MDGWISAAWFALACNLDTLLLAVTFGLRARPVTGRACWILSGVTTCITVISLVLGRRLGAVLPGRTGGLVLVVVGLWTVLDWLRGRDTPAGPEPDRVCWLPLAAALGVNNAGAGLAAGASGISFWWGGWSNFGCTLLLLWLGGRLAVRLGDRELGRWAEPLSGLLLALLGLWMG